MPSIAKGPAPFGLIEHVVTAQDFRGRGLADQAMRYLLDAAWRRGCYKVMLLSGAQRADAHRLYARLGFDGDAERGYVIKPPPREAPEAG